jgi:hypothetical protein
MIVSVPEEGEQRSLTGVRIAIRVSQLRALASLGAGEYDFAGVRLVVSDDPPKPVTAVPPIEDR